MAHIKNIFICPKCDEGITASGKIDKCPGCGHIVGSMGEQYKHPLTLVEQHQKYQDTARFRDAVLDLPIQKCECMLLDALKIIETLPGKKATPADIRKIVETATFIGKIAESYDAYLRAGGKHVPSLFINNIKKEQYYEPVQTRGSPEATPAGSPEPAPAFFLPGT